MAEIKEKSLIVPALYFMAENGNQILTSDLIVKLTDVMQPTGTDAEILAGRNDTHFSQKVRNLKSHDALVRRGFAKDIDGGFAITAAGKAHLAAHIDEFKYLVGNTFAYDVVKTELARIEDDAEHGRKRSYFIEIVEEGNEKIASTTYKRSVRLRNIAREHFTHNGHIQCDCCHFDFSTAYAAPYNKECIEIHHIIPLANYEHEDVEKSVEAALKNLMPVCPNCHRVIHKNGILTVKKMSRFKASFVAM